MANRYGSIKYFIVWKFFCCLIARLLYDQVIQLHNDFNCFQLETQNTAFLACDTHLGTAVVNKMIRI